MLLLIGGGGGAWWFFSDDEEDGQTERPATAQPAVVKPKPKKAEAPVYVNLEQFTVNLQPDGGEHFLQVVITLQVASKEDVDLIKLYMPQMRSRVLLLLTSKKKSELITIEGKKKLSEEIMAQVNQPFTPDAPRQNVTNVHFTTFIVQ
jgi:flagellar protein FliL